MNLVVHGDRLPMSGVVVLLLDVGEVLRVVALRKQKMSILFAKKCGIVIDNQLGLAYQGRV